MNDNFLKFLEKFPVITPPMIISEEAHLSFSQENKPFSQDEIKSFIAPYEEDIDEFTEFIPGFRFEFENTFQVTLYWKAALMHYQYVLMVWNKDNLIDRSVVAGTIVDQDTVMRSVASIDEDYIIHIVSSHSQEESADVKTERHFTMEIMANGSIISVDPV